MILAERLTIPDKTQAILWDMDGVLLDTLGLDFSICNDLLHKYFGTDIRITRSYIRSIFPYDPPEFWRLILYFVEKEFAVPNPLHRLDDILGQYNEARTSTNFKICPGIENIIEDAVDKGLLSVVVSNNPVEDVREILTKTGLVYKFNDIIGNDIKGLRKKPAPDCYLFAAKRNKLLPENCVVVEDSVLGVEAGHSAGCYTIGVATGGADFYDLEASGWTNSVYFCFERNRIQLRKGNVVNKEISSPNDFVSHMVEHITWRTGCEINLRWHSNDWKALGSAIGKQFESFPRDKNCGVALGMIDDGTSEVLIEVCEDWDFEIEAINGVDLPWFLQCRCEQVTNGQPLIELLKGLAEGLKVKIRVRVCTFEDPHHTWEGIFRAVGISLSKILHDELKLGEILINAASKREKYDQNVKVLHKSINMAQICRKTAESEIDLKVDFSSSPLSEYTVSVGSSVNVTGLHKLLETLARELSCSIQGQFTATALCSSHVVVEDTALVLGRVLKEIFTSRMEKFGVEGAGSSIDSAKDFREQPIRVALSIEGRKFWRFVPFDISFTTLQKEIIIGHTVFGDMFSEDLDDFIDGLTGGLSCSVVVHFKQLLPPQDAWSMIFRNLGKAIKESFNKNPSRKGVPPGVKATLA